jgi:hypothetical protein
MEEDQSYKEKYKALKRKFKAIQAVISSQEHLKVSTHLDTATKTIKSMLREKQ